MKSLAIYAGALTASFMMASALQAGTHPPAIADYLNRTPTVLGSVTASNDHSVTLSTDSGSPMTFVIDSRSVVPAELPAGSRVRVQFHALGADAFHAGRITPLTAAEIRAIEESSAPRMRAASEPATENWGTSSTAAEEPAPVPLETPAGTATTEAAADETAAPSTIETDAVPPATETAPEQETDELPRTAGSLPLVATGGALALAAAIAIGFLRRRRV